MISVESQTKKVTPQPPYQPLGWSYRYVYIALEARGEPRGGPRRAQGGRMESPGRAPTGMTSLAEKGLYKKTQNGLG